jgi:N-methylhydantoinase B/oxoprolinase/acetone carboxylase alpha subunit
MIDSDGEERGIAGKGMWQMRKGDAIRLETPGGGGWGDVSKEPGVRDAEVPEYRRNSGTVL